MKVIHYLMTAIFVVPMIGCTSMKASYQEWQEARQEAWELRQFKTYDYTNGYFYESRGVFEVRTNWESETYGVEWYPKPQRVFLFPVEINTSYETHIVRYTMSHPGRLEHYFDKPCCDFVAAPDKLKVSEYFTEEPLEAFNKYQAHWYDEPGVYPISIRSLGLQGHPVLSTLLERGMDFDYKPYEIDRMNMHSPTAEFIEQVSDYLGGLGPGDALLFVFMDLVDNRVKEPDNDKPTFYMGRNFSVEMQRCRGFEGSHAARTVGFSGLLIDYEGYILRSGYEGFYFDESIFRHYDGCGFDIMPWSRSSDAVFTDIDPDAFWQSLQAGHLDASWPSALDHLVEKLIWNKKP